MVSLNGTMMKLGPIKFRANSINYNSLDRKDEYRWANLDLLNTSPIKQAMGVGNKTITLSGVIYTEHTNLNSFGLAAPVPGLQNFALNVSLPNLPLVPSAGLNRMNEIRIVADKQEPLLLVDGLGKNWGYWVIKSITDRQTNFLINGAFLKQEFDLELEAFDSSASTNAGISPITRAVRAFKNQANKVVPTTISSVFSSVGGLVA